MKRSTTIALLSTLLMTLATSASAGITGIRTEDGSEIDFSATKSIGRIVQADLGGDGTEELVIGALEGEQSHVSLLRSDGSEIHSWLAYSESFDGGVRVAVADLNADGKKEIITAPGPSGGPHIRIFDGFGGEFHPGFFAFDPENKKGVEITTLKLGIYQLPILVAGTWIDGVLHIQTFDTHGKALLYGFTLPQLKAGSDYKLAALDLGTDGAQELLVAGTTEQGPRVLLLRLDGSLIADHEAGFTNPHALAVGSDKTLAWITPEASLTRADSFGVTLSETPLEGRVAPHSSLLASADLLVHRRPHLGTRTSGKYIEVSIDEDRMRYFEDGVLVKEHIVSLGKPSSPTPEGSFQIENKFENAFSRRAGLWMPHWMAIVPSGLYGFHALPHTPSGRIEGESSLGHKVSGGCIRLARDAAEEFYSWAEVGTQVFIQ